MKIELRYVSETRVEPRTHVRTHELRALRACVCACACVCCVEWIGVEWSDAARVDCLCRDTPITIRRPLAPDQALNDKRLILLDITSYR